jgi:hypothetical protein
VFTAPTDFAKNFEAALKRAQTLKSSATCKGSYFVNSIALVGKASGSDLSRLTSQVGKLPFCH